MASARQQIWPFRLAMSLPLKATIIASCLAVTVGATIFALLQPLNPDPYQTSIWKRFWYPVQTNPYARLYGINCADDYACRLNNIFVSGGSDQKEVWAVGNVGLLLHKIGHGSWERIIIKIRPSQGVNLTISNEQSVSSSVQLPGVATPALIGLTLNQAFIVARSSGLQITTTFAPGAKGIVIRQFQPPGARVAVGSTIDVVIGNSPEGPDDRTPSSAGIGSRNQNRNQSTTATVLPVLNDDFLAIDCKETDCQILGRRGLIYTGPKDGSGPWTLRPARFSGRVERLLEASSITNVWGEGPSGVVPLHSTTGSDSFIPSVLPIKVPAFNQNHQIVWWQSPEGLEVYDFTQSSKDDTTDFSVGSSGLIQRVDRSGSVQYWRRLPSGTTASLYCIRFFEGADNTGWIVGDHGIILSSSGDLNVWVHETQGPEGAAQDRKLPAPWYWAMLGFVILVCSLTIASPELPAVTEISVADRAVSDAPLRPGDQDVLAFMPTVLGLSRFVRNQKTQPPLTLAIEGNWGEGKSSLMSLLCDDLKKSRFRPIWFNAWHHQSEDQLLAALLEHIRSQGLPTWWHFDNLIFRTRLLWIRLGQIWIVMLAVLLVFLASAAYEYAHVQQDHEHTLNQSLVNTIAQVKARWSKFWTNVDELSKQRPHAQSNPESSNNMRNVSQQKETAANSPSANPVVDGPNRGEIDIGLYSFVASLLGLVIAVLRKFRAFGINSKKLADNLRDAVTVKDLKSEPGIRREFQREFNDVCQAWSWGARRLIIFIDDLDRCRPDSVVTVLESVNFLTTAGDCIVIMGIARETVIHSVGLSFKEIAETQALYNGRGMSDMERAQARFEYGELYIRKLVNMSIPLPKTTENQRKQLLKGEIPTRDKASVHRWRLQLWKILSGVGYVIARLAPVCVIVSLGILIGSLGYRMGLSSKELGEQSKQQQLGNKAQSKSQAPPAANLTPSTPTRIKTMLVKRPTEEVATLASHEGDRISTSWWSALCYSGAFLMLLGFLVYILRSRSNQDAENSIDFEDSLDIWDQFIVTICETPRELKRILNDLRCQAMMRRNDGPSFTRAERLIRYCRQVVTGTKESNLPCRRLDEADLPLIKVSELISISTNERDRFLDPDDVRIFPADSETCKLLVDSKKRHIKRFGRWLGSVQSERAVATTGNA